MDKKEKIKDLKKHKLKLEIKLQSKIGVIRQFIREEIESIEQEINKLKIHDAANKNTPKL